MLNCRANCNLAFDSALANIPLMNQTFIRVHISGDYTFADKSFCFLHYALQSARNKILMTSKIRQFMWLIAT